MCVCVSFSFADGNNARKESNNAPVAKRPSSNMEAPSSHASSSSATLLARFSFAGLALASNRRQIQLAVRRNDAQWSSTSTRSLGNQRSQSLALLSQAASQLSGLLGAATFHFGRQMALRAAKLSPFVLVCALLLHCGS